MQTSQLVTPGAAAGTTPNTNHHHLNNNNNNSYHYNPHFHNTSHSSNNNNHHTMSYTPHEQTNTFNNTQPTHHHHNSATATNTTTTNSNTPIAAHKYAPARRLAARQTLRLQIPKQQGDSCGAPSTYYKHSPSQLPPAPILKRHQTPTPTSATHQYHSSANAFPKSASPLESHKLPNVVCSSASPSSQLSSGSSLYYNGSNGGLSIQTATATPSCGTNKFLHLRKPSITLNTADVRNNNGNSTGSIGSCGSDLFSFAKELSPSMDMSDHSPIFAEIASSISPSTSSGCSPTHHINRLFSLSPSTIRSYGNVSNLY